VRLLYLIAIIAFLQQVVKMIDVNLENAAPKLVIEAAINWRKGTTETNKKIN
jgi:hypothetical protein